MDSAVGMNDSVEAAIDGPVKDHHRGIRLHLACGSKKQPSFVGLDRVAGPGVDIVHDVESFPYPIADGECLTILASNIVEHVKPWLTIQLFDEMWRIMKVGGQLALATPYGGSYLYMQDPTHCNPFVPATFEYFDPRCKAWQIYKPKPWAIATGFPVWQPTGMIEVVMTKLGEQ